jgi:DNA-binding beta-propeller fold protein YncE
MVLRTAVSRNVSRLKRAATILLPLICLSCGETYRPVANPVTPNPPNPSFSHVALVISGNGANNPGAGTSIDVSGDTAVSQATVGLMPSYAALAANGTRAFVTNSLDNAVSEFSPSSPTPVTTISLPSGSVPTFAGTAETSTVYVVNSGAGNVSAISINSNVITNTITVGVNPVALVETPVTSVSGPQKVYVANQGGSVSVISSVDKSVSTAIGTWTSPVWAAARSDANRVYILDSAAGTVSAIDTANDTELPATASVGAGANFMAYDPIQNRLYVTNPAANLLSIIDVSNDSLTTSSLAVTAPISVAVLPDGSRIYVASALVSGGIVNSSVSVVNTGNLSIATTIPLASVTQSCISSRFELSVAASADGTRVYVGNCDVGNTTIIQTTTDTVVTNLPAPTSAAPASTISVTAAVQSGSNTTYSYALTSGPALRLRMNVVVENIENVGDDGTFPIVGLGTGTFTVVNPNGVTASGQSGTGTATTPQNPVFVVAGP